MREVDQSRRARPGAARHTARAPLGRRARAATLIASTALAGCGDLDGLAGPSSAPPDVSSFAAARGALGDAGTVIPGQYIVVFRDSVRDAPGLARRLVAEHGGELRFSYTSAIKGFAARLPEQAVEALGRNPRVAQMEQDRAVVGTDVQTPTPSWGLDRIDQRARPLSNSYGYATAGAGVNVYILDSGIRTTHTDFGGRAVQAFSVIADGRGAGDCNGHGTHVAGTVGGTRYGVAKLVALHSVRVLDCAGGGTTSGVIAGIDWVTQHRVLPAVANLSLEGSKSSTLNAAVQNSAKAGVLYAVAAGNSAADACNFSPASTPEALTVGASWNGDGVAGYSNVGGCVDIFAPGSAIRSDAIIDDTSSVVKGGTSMAAPHVAGVAALYLGVNTAATPAQTAAAIVDNATANVLADVPSGTPNLLIYSGLHAGPPPADTTTPAPAPTPTTPVIDHPPIAGFTASCARSRCTFDASGSSDDVAIAMFSWTYGDGSPTTTSASAVRVVHRYLAPGTYTVTLTVTDTAGQRSAHSATLTIRKA